MTLFPCMSFMAWSFPFAASADLRMLCQLAKDRAPASVRSIFRTADITSVRHSVCCRHPREGRHGFFYCRRHLAE
jgi:hypothetical protein